MCEREQLYSHIHRLLFSSWQRWKMKDSLFPPQTVKCCFRHTTPAHNPPSLSCLFSLCTSPYILFSSSSPPHVPVFSPLSGSLPVPSFTPSPPASRSLADHSDLFYPVFISQSSVYLDPSHTASFSPYLSHTLLDSPPRPPSLSISISRDSACLPRRIYSDRHWLRLFIAYSAMRQEAQREPALWTTFLPTLRAAVCP